MIGFTSEVLLQFGLALIAGSTFLLVSAFAIQWCFGKLSAAERFSIWQTSLVGLLLLPVCCLLLPTANLGWFAKASPSVISTPRIADNAVPSPISSGPTSEASTVEAEDFGADISAPHQSDREQATGSIPVSEFVKPDVKLQFEPDSMLNRVSMDSEKVDGQSEANFSFGAFLASTSQWFQVHAGTLLLVWLVVAAYFLVRIVWSCLWANSIRKQAVPFPSGHLRAIEKQKTPILVSSEIAVPITVGVLKPAVIIPSDSLNMKVANLRMVLKHELAHVERRDVLWQLVTATAKSLFWFQPLVWIAERHMRLERERACDDRVVGSNESPQEYAMALLRIAAKCSGLKVEFAGALSMAQKPIESRLITILEPETRRRTSSRLFKLSLCTIFAVAVLAVSIVRPFASPAQAMATSDSNESVPAEVQEPESTGEKANPDSAQAAQDSAVEMIELPAEISGKIVDKDGQPIPGATADIKLYPYAEWNIPGQTKSHKYPLVIANDKGVFVLKTKGIKVPRAGFKITGYFSGPTNPKRRWAISVQGFAEKIEKGQPVEIPSFSLSPGRVIKGRIVAPESDGMVLADPEDAFVQGAQGHPSTWSEEIVHCDESGNFEMVIPKAGLVELMIGAQNYACVRVQVPPKENDLGEIRLFEGTEVFGTLTDLDGKPVVGAVVVISELGENKQSQLDGRHFPIESAAKTDSKGKYRLPPHRGQCLISVVKGRSARGSDKWIKSDSSCVFPPQEFALKDGEKQHRLDLKESLTTWVHGTIRWPDGRPCPNVKFRSYSEYGGHSQPADESRSDKDGKYSLRVLRDAEKHHINGFGSKAEDGTWHYGKVPGEAGVQYATLKGTGKDVHDFDWTLVNNLKSTTYHNATEAGQALDEIAFRLNKDRKAFYKKLKDEGVGITNEIRYGQNSPFQKYPDELLEFEKEYRGEFSALCAFSSILAWSDGGLSSAQANRKEVLDRIRKHYLKHEDIHILVDRFSGKPLAVHRPHVPRIEDEREDERELYELIRKTNPHEGVQAKILFQDLSGKADVCSLIRALEKRKWVIPLMSTRDELLALKKFDPEKLRADAEATLVKLKSTYPAVIRPKHGGGGGFSGLQGRPSDSDISLRMNKVKTYGTDETMTYAEKAEAIMLDAFHLQPGKKVPEVVGKDAYGKPFKLSDLKSKAVVLYFAIADSREFFAHQYEVSRDLRKKYKGKLEIVTIMLDKKPDTIRAAIDAGDITWRAIDDGENGPIARAWNIDGLDREAFLIDGNGVIVERVGQGIGLAERVEKMMKGQPF